MRVYFVRHGESVANATKRHSPDHGHETDRLTPKGQRQATTLGKRLASEKIEKIFSSPMTRAQETAAGIAKVLKLPVEIHPELYETRKSEKFYETGSRDTHHHVNWMTANADDPRYTEGGAESFSEIMKRVKQFEAELLDSKAERVAVVSHGDFLCFFLGHVLFRDSFKPEDIKALKWVLISNTGISIFLHRPQGTKIAGGDFSGWSLVTWNDDGHLS